MCCCWLFDRVVGWCVVWFVIFICVSKFMVCVLVVDCDILLVNWGSMMFFSVENLGSRWWNWYINLMLLWWMDVCWWLFKVFVLMLLILMIFLFGVFNRFVICSRVDLFVFDGVISVIILFLVIVRLILLRIWILFGLLRLYFLVRFDSCRMLFIV